MKIKKVEIFNEKTNKVEEIEIWGYCCYCKDPILINDKYKKKKDGLYHNFCWSQKHK